MAIGWAAAFCTLLAVFGVGSLVVHSWALFNGGSGTSSGREMTSDEAMAGVFLAACSTVGVSGLVWWDRRVNRFDRRPVSRPVTRCVATFAIFGVVLVIGAAIQILALASDAPAERLGWAAVWTISAGFLEEPVFAALPTVIAGYFRRKMLFLVPLIVFSALSRGVMHLYQGWERGVLAVGWGAAAAIIYAVLGSLAGLIAAHVLHNLTIIAIYVTDIWIWVWGWAGVVAAAVLWSLIRRRELIEALSPRDATSLSLVKQ